MLLARVRAEARLAETAEVGHVLAELQRLKRDLLGTVTLCVDLAQF